MAKEMTATKASNSEKGGAFEYILLATCVAVIACRTTLTEAPGTTTTSEDNIFNAASSAFLILAAFSWLISHICKKQFSYRFTGIEYGLIIFIAAAIIGTFAASNKRAAIDNSVMMLAPMLMAILLAQILNSSIKIKLLLYVIVALGVVNAYECIDQYGSSNQMTIDEYKRDPASMLNRLAIEQGSFQQMLFEHRLYSKDIRGFFTTGNSAGSFALLALAAAAALMMEKRKALTAGFGTAGELVARGLIVVMIAVGLGLTHSKGALAAVFAAVLFFVMYKLAGQWLAKNKWMVIILALLVIVACSSGMIWYGITHDTLPGGKSMLVRWQYWVGAAKIYAAHPLTGAGPGNFMNYYPTYKIPAGLETVKDPHNFILSILTQYGPLGLVGFLAALLVPLGYTIFITGDSSNSRLSQGTSQFRKIALSFMALAVVTLLAVRPLILRAQLGNDVRVMLVVITWLYVLPAAIFLVTFLFLSVSEKQIYLDRSMQVILFCAIVGLLIHNLVDFALFEPGVYTAFWAVVAVVMAMSFNQNREREYSIMTPTLPAAMVVIGSFVALWAYTTFCVMPVIKSSTKIGRAMAIAENALMFADSNSISPAQTRANLLPEAFDWANRWLQDAADDDTLSPDALIVSARICREFYRISGQTEEKFLSWAQNRLLAAIGRDPANFKNYEQLAEVLKLMADRLPADKQAELLQKAYTAINEAIVRYPGSERLRMAAGRLAECLGKKGEAIVQYRKAVEIEDSYRIMFEKMYPGTPLFSRIGESEYKFAKNRITELSR